MAVDAYRIPSGHKGGGRFAKRGQVGEAIVDAVKSVYHGMADAELDAERTDLTESIDHSASNKAAAAERLDAQVERTTKVYGDRPHWPADAEHGVRQIEAEVTAADTAIREATEARDELDAVRVGRSTAAPLNVSGRAVTIDPALPDDVRADIANDAQAFLDRYPDFLDEVRSIELSDHNTGFANKDRHRVLLNRKLWNETDWDARHAEWEPYLVDTSPGGTVVHELGHILDGALLAQIADIGDPDLRARYEAFSTPDGLQTYAPSVYGMENRYEFMAELLAFEHYGQPLIIRARPDLRDAAAAKLTELHDLIADVRAARSPGAPPEPADLPDPEHHLSAAPTVNELVEAPERPDVDLPPPYVPPDLAASEAAAEQAIQTLNGFHHLDVGINGVSLPTLPTIAGGSRWADRPLDPATQRLALDRLFNPTNTDGLIGPLPILDASPATAGRPLGMVAVNVESGEIIGTHAAWSPYNVPSNGTWVALPADHPQAPALVAAAWLASAPVKRYIDTNLLPRLRDGRTIDPTFAGLNEVVRSNSDRLVAVYRGHPDVAVRRVTTPEGTFYVPDPNGHQSIDGDSIRFADFSEDGGVRLWADKIAVNEPDVTDRLAAVDYSVVDDESKSWDDRVAALGKARAEIQAIFGDFTEMFSHPTEDDVPDLLLGPGNEREFAHVAALERFGESLEALVAQREIDTAPDAAPIDKAAVLAKLREIPGVPPALADYLESEPWAAQVVGAIIPASPAAPNGGGRVDITFPGQPDSRVTVFTSVRGAQPQTYVGWEFSAAHQMDSPDVFTAFPPSTMMTTSPGYAPGDWFEMLGDPAVTPRLAPGENTTTMTAWLDTMEALGVDMGTDRNLYFAAGRDRDGEMVGQPERGAEPVLLDHLDDTGILGRTADAGLRPYPQSWTQSLGGRLIRIDIDPDRSQPAGASSSFDRPGPDVGVLDLPSIDSDPGFVDVATHEFAHQFQKTVPGLLLIETWHFIARLRDEAQRTQALTQWKWDEKRYGFVDEFGDEYMGRIYKNPNTGVEGVTSMGGSEIFSTAAQTLWATADRSRPDLDPKARRLLMATMATLDPPDLDPDDRWTP